VNIPTFNRRSLGRRAARLLRVPVQAAAVSSEPASLQDILITSKLKSRRRRKPNHYAENAALQSLARVMTTSPETLIDTLLKLALELCSAGTAGLSLRETNEQGEQIFRWTNLAGALRKHIGGSTPRDFSPCGVTVDRNAPQLFTLPGRRFQYFNGLDFTIVEALVIPVYLGAETPGTIWIVSHDDEIKFDSEDARIMTGLAEFTTCALQLTRLSDVDRTARREGAKEIAEHKLTEKTLRHSQGDLQAVVDARTEQLRQLSANLMDMQDQERRRIARDLHDSVGQYLAGIQMNLSSFLSHAPGLADPERSRIADSIEMAERCTSEIRTISYLLHPPLLDETGLRSALSWYVEGFAQRSGIQVALEIPETLGRLPNDTETALFRVIQQSLANIHRHSGSQAARIVLDLTPEFVTLEISDQGTGIAAETLADFHSGTRLPGVGMVGMRERVLNMDGKFHVASSDQGTRLQISLPLPANAQSASA